MHVLVTGGAGFIGSHIVDNLLARGYRVRVLDNLITGSADYLPQHRDVEFIKGDVTDLDTCLRAMEGVEGVFHLAAMSKVAPSHDPEMFDYCTQQNVVGSGNVLCAALRNKDRVRKVVYAASSACYGSAPIPTHEDTWPLDNQTPYALTKYVAELYCEQYTRLYGLPTVRCRYYMAFGPRQPTSGPYRIATGTFMKAWMEGKPLPVMGGGQQTRDFIHVAELAEGNVRAFESNATDATINLGTGKNVTILEIAKIFSDNIEFVPPRVPDIPHQLSDTTRMREMLGWMPKSDVVAYFKDEVRRLVRENPTLAKPEWLRVEESRLAETAENAA
jgi:nucleoside-diphosphate-sugar epimerase